MKTIIKKVRYIIYCRKSSESEDKQIQSIGTQIRELTEYAEKLGIEIVDILTEEQSAHTVGRPVFASLISRINKGEADGVLVLFANRLSRNPIDGGMIIHLMDTGKLKEVRTTSHTFTNTSTEKMMLSIEFMISKKDSDDKSDFVKTGLKTRYLKGYPNGVAPIGYLNDKLQEKGNRGWVVDKTTFPLIKQLLTMFLTGRYSIRQITKIANEELGLRTTLRKKQGGKRLVFSYVSDSILKNPIYAGFFYTKDEDRHELSKDMPRMISEEEYWHIQKIIGNRGRQRPKSDAGIFAYKGPTTCGECGGFVTAEHKYQLICPNSKCKLKFSYKNKEECPGCNLAIDEMENPTYLHYIFYHCTKKKHPDCKQRCIEEKVADKIISNYYKKNLKISDELSKWCIDNLDSLNNNKKETEFERKVSLENTLKKKEIEYKELILMKTKGLIEDDDFSIIKDSLKAEIGGLKGQLEGYNDVDNDRLTKARKAFNLARGIDRILSKGSPEEKRELISEIGSNLTLKDKNINVYNTKIYSTIINGLLTAKTKNPQFEPENIVDISDRNEVFVDVCPTLLHMLNEVRTHLYNS